MRNGESESLISFFKVLRCLLRCELIAEKDLKKIWLTFRKVVSVRRKATPPVEVKELEAVQTPYPEDEIFCQPFELFLRVERQDQRSSLK